MIGVCNIHELGARNQGKQTSLETVIIVSYPPISILQYKLLYSVFARVVMLKSSCSSSFSDKHTCLLQSSITFQRQVDRYKPSTC